MLDLPIGVQAPLYVSHGIRLICNIADSPGAKDGLRTFILFGMYP